MIKENTKLETSTNADTYWEALKLTCEELETRITNTSVTNLSDYTLTSNEANALAKGLKFIPTPEKLKTDEVKKQIWEYIRKLQWSVIHQNRSRRINLELTRKFHINKNTTPPIPLLPENFMAITDKITEDVIELSKIRLKDKPSKNNMSKQERQALKTLMQNDDITIVASDKNLGLVILNTSTYDHSVLQTIIQDRNFTETTETFDRIKHTVLALTEEITNTPEFKKLPEWKLLKRYIEVKTRQVKKLIQFYAIPKIHKQNLEMRPIAPNINTLTEAAAKVADHFLQPVAKKGIGYIGNSTEVIKLINNFKYKADMHTVLYTADVQRLYPSIPMDLIIGTLEDIKREQKELECIIELAKIVIRNTYITYKQTTYKQTEGIATGSPLAPTIANIVLNRMEEKPVKEMKKNANTIFVRYIDDIFGIYQGDENQFKKFIDEMSNLHKNIKLTWKIHEYNDQGKDILMQEFLDINVIIDCKKGSVFTEPYQKPINKYLYLPFSSCHPLPSLKGWITAELKRYKRLSTKKSTYKTFRNLFYIRLRNRGYPINFLNRIFREKQEFPKPNLYNEENIIYFKSKYDGNNFSPTKEINPQALAEYEIKGRICKTNSISIGYKCMRKLKIQLSK